MKYTHLSLRRFSINPAVDPVRALRARLGGSKPLPPPILHQVGRQARKEGAIHGPRRENPAVAAVHALPVVSLSVWPTARPALPYTV